MFFYNVPETPTWSPAYYFLPKRYAKMELIVQYLASIVTFICGRCIVRDLSRDVLVVNFGSKCRGLAVLDLIGRIFDIAGRAGYACYISDIEAIPELLACFLLVAF